MTFPRPAAAPVLTSDRLVLRPLRPDDLDASHALWCEESVYRFISGKPSNRQDCWFRLLNFVGMWSMMGFGYWAVEHRETGDYVGEVGFADFKRALSVDIEGHPEMGWILSPRFFGQGLGHEAVSCALRWAQETLPFDEVFCIIAPENHASARLAQRAGFVQQSKPVVFNEAPTLFFRRPLDRNTQS